MTYSSDATHLKKHHLKCTQSNAFDNKSVDTEMDGVDDFAKDYQPQSSQYSRQFMWLNTKGKGHVLRCSIKYIMLPSTHLLKYIEFAFAKSYKYVYIF